MKMRSYHSLLLLPLLILTSCSNESKSDLEDFPLVENVTYTNNVKPIIDNNCLGCHGEPTTISAPMPLNSYVSVQEFVQNDIIIDRIYSSFISRNENEESK